MSRALAALTVLVPPLAAGLLAVPPPQAASTPNAVATRLAILAAEDRRAALPSDLRIIRSGARSPDAQTARIAIRALGRLERPDLIADILPGLRHALPEVRAEAANAVAQAAQGRPRPSPTVPKDASWLDSATSALAARLNVELDSNVRSTMAEAIGRLPYASAAQADNGERALLALLQRRQSAPDRVGVASGLEALTWTRRKLNVQTIGALGPLRSLAVLPTPSKDAEAGSRSAGRIQAAADPAREARVRRLAMEALGTSGSVDDGVARQVVRDPDVQVRRLLMRALSAPQMLSPSVAVEIRRQGLADASPSVRLEALRATSTRAPSAVEGGQTGPPALDPCGEAVRAARDVEPHVAIVALDQLATCPTTEAIDLLEQALAGWSDPGAPRSWHRPAHALVALAGAAPERASATLPRFSQSTVVYLRMYAARAAAVLRDRRALETLAGDIDDNVREAAIDGLASVAGHEADAVYVAALAKGGHQVLRSAAIALTGTRAPDAAQALSAAYRRLMAEGRDNSSSARTSITDALRGLGASVNSVRPPASVQGTPTGVPRWGPRRSGAMTAADLRRVTSARARVTVRGVGSFSLAVIGAEAPITALRFVRLVESGYYNGLMLHRVVPNFVVQGGSPGGNEYIGDSPFMRDEVGRWPHVRGAVGISTRGRDTGDAQIFVDLVDNPRLDHEYTVFAHVLSGMEVVDAILEGDVIDRIEIVRGP